MKLALKEIEKDGDVDSLLDTLRLVARAQGEARPWLGRPSVSRQALSKALAPTGNPRLRTFQSVLEPLEANFVERDAAASVDLSCASTCRRHRSGARLFSLLALSTSCYDLRVLLDKSTEEVEVAAEAALRNDRAGLLDRFDALVARDGLSKELESRILERGKAKEVFPCYPENEETRALYGRAVNRAAAGLIEQLYRRRLETAPSGATVALTGGGPGSGKSSLISFLAPRLIQEGLFPWVIVDGTMADYDRVAGQIGLASAREVDVEVWFLFRDFPSSVRGFIERAANIGRAIPLRAVAEKHRGAWVTLLRLIEAEVVSVDAVSVFQMMQANEGAKAFVSTGLDCLREALAARSLQEMIELAYETLDGFAGRLPRNVHDQLSKR